MATLTPSTDTISRSPASPTDCSKHEYSISQRLILHKLDSQTIPAPLIRSFFLPAQKAWLAVLWLSQDLDSPPCFTTTLRRFSYLTWLHNSLRSIFLCSFCSLPRLIITNLGRCESEDDGFGCRKAEFICRTFLLYNMMVMETVTVGDGEDDSNGRIISNS